MSTYKAPVADMMFTLEHVVGLKGLPVIEDLSPADISLILESAGQLATDVLAPLNHTGDRAGVHLQDGVVTTAKGFKEAYRAYCDGGWNGVPFDPDFGGQGLPWVLSFAIQEMWQSANMAFGLCPMLTQAAIEAFQTLGTTEQKKTYLGKLVSGEWCGTMNLTEPDAGSDLAAVKTKAVKQDDGTYRLFGQKIFITYGEHDFTDNIVHLVLARLPDAPAGTKGISMFIVPKFIPDAGGAPGARNDVTCVSIEHKLGIHASPTCTMQFGDAGGAVGYLIGRENEGLKHMFIMMNNARLAVGLQGVAIAERAYQHALAYARDRRQGTRDGNRVAIIEHPDVKRMLLSMKVRTEAARALAYEAGRMLDLAHAGDKEAQERVDLLTPIVKSWCTDVANDVASTGIQIHGGMGFIEETGAAQYFRDARILPIYEGTNGIQAQDLAFRKLVMNEGRAMKSWLAACDVICADLLRHDERDMHDGLQAALAGLREATDFLLEKGRRQDNDAISAVSVPYLNACGVFAGGVMMARGVLAACAAQDHSALHDGKTLSAAFYMTHVLPAVFSFVRTVLSGSDSVEACNAGYW